MIKNLPHPSGPLGGVKIQIFKFPNNCQHAEEVQQIRNISNLILDRRPGSNPLGCLRSWGRGQNSTFSEYCYVAYQIKRNDACSDMVANSCPQTTPRPWGCCQKVKIQLFQNMFMLHIILNGITNKATCRWRSKMLHANFKGGFWNFKIWIKRRVLLPILCQMTF